VQENNMPGFEKDSSEIGALWSKNGPKGEYLTGQINGEPVVVFRNTKKTEGSKQPDWRVLKPTPKPEATAAPASGQALSDSDIPF